MANRKQQGNIMKPAMNNAFQTKMLSLEPKKKKKEIFKKAILFTKPRKIERLHY